MPDSHSENHEEPGSWVPKWLQRGRKKTVKTIQTGDAEPFASVALVASVARAKDGRRADADVATGDRIARTDRSEIGVEASVLAILSCAHCEVETPGPASRTRWRCGDSSLYARVGHMVDRVRESGRLRRFGRTP